jgi:raffinose/stachyose/melibiose transport system substrate-binding protein
MGALVKAGLLENLTPYAQKYGWDKKISAGIVARNSFAADGKVFGEGNLYGIAPTAELVGVFYRKDKFEEFGLSVPKTFGEFENILKTIKDKGDVPFAVGDLTGLAATHYISELLFVNVTDRAYVDDLIYGRNNRSWETPEVIQAATTLQEWVKNGYFNPGFEGISYDDQQTLFEGGAGDMMLTGSWWSSGFAAGPLKDKLGFFLVPPMKEGDYKMTTGGTSTAYAIRATSANKELAAEYIDNMVSEASAKLWVDSQTVPVPLIDPSAVPQGTMFGDLVTSWNAMNKNDAVGHYLDWATPTFYDTITAALEELMGVQITPEEFAKKLQSDYGAYLEQKTP